MSYPSLHSMNMPSSRCTRMREGARLESGAALITSLIFMSILTVLGMTTLGTSILESRMAGNARDRVLAFQAAEMGLRDAELYIRDSGRIVNLTEIGYGQTGTCDPEAGNCDDQICKHGVCKNGGDMNKDGSNWVANPIWRDETKWVNALQYAHDDSEAGAVGLKKIVGYGKEVELTLFNASLYNNDINQCKSVILGTCAYSQPSKLPLVARQPEYLIEPFSKGEDATKCAIGTGNPCYYRITVRGYGTKTSTRVILQEVYTPSAP